MSPGGRGRWVAVDVLPAECTAPVERRCRAPARRRWRPRSSLKVLSAQPPQPVPGHSVQREPPSAHEAGPAPATGRPLVKVPVAAL